MSIICISNCLIGHLFKNSASSLFPLDIRCASPPCPCACIIQQFPSLSQWQSVLLIFRSLIIYSHADKAHFHTMVHMGSIWSRSYIYCDINDQNQTLHRTLPYPEELQERGHYTLSRMLFVMAWRGSEEESRGRLALQRNLA